MTSRNYGSTGRCSISFGFWQDLEDLLGTPVDVLTDGGVSPYMRERIFAETPEGHVLRYAPGSTQVIGLTVVCARQTLERDGRLSITVPETIETTAEDLAPALAAA